MRVVLSCWSRIWVIDEFDDDIDLKRYQQSLVKRAYENMERSYLFTKFFNKYYDREELDLSLTATPFCPDCEEELVPHQ